MYLSSKRQNNQATIQSISQSTNQSFNHASNQAIYSICEWSQDALGKSNQSSTSSINQCECLCMTVIQDDLALSFRQDAHNLLAQKVVDLSKVLNPSWLAMKFSTATTSKTNTDKDVTWRSGREDFSFGCLDSHMPSCALWEWKHFANCVCVRAFFGGVSQSKKKRGGKRSTLMAR